MVVTHDIANCAEKVADRVALLDKGKFVFNGTIEELYRSSSPVLVSVTGPSCSNTAVRWFAVDGLRR